MGLILLAILIVPLPLMLATAVRGLLARELAPMAREHAVLPPELSPTTGS
jgi:hypothetical protein